MPKAIRELADEFGVSKQAIREKTISKINLKALSLLTHIAASAGCSF
ncbi:MULTISPECIES: hypothetical protein [Lactobacillaceae]|nr:MULTISPECIES: hypothetical protein [Lactobacillaceae]AJA81464.1 hypothetical protein L747_00015 [Levilactobacillus brevis BSO 464]